MKKRTDPTKDKQLTQDLDRKMAEIVAMLKGTLKNDTPLVLRNEAILKAKAALLGMSFVKMIDGVPDRLSENIWKSIKGSYDSVIGGYADIIEHLKPELVKENPARNDTEFRELIDAAKELEEELRSVSEQKEEMKKSFEQEKHELLSRIAALEEENKKLVKKPEVPSRSFPDQPLKDVRRYSPGVAPPPSKSMTLKQLKDLIFDMYHQKAKYDEKCAENRQPKETMEQYMYVYLNQIYGLKSLIIEGAGGIIQGIKKYSSVDSDVALFGKILRNECDEDFKLVFNEVKVAMTNILKERLKKKYKLKTETELNKMVKDIQQGEIEENYWAAIIRKMYNEEHYGILTGRIKEKIELDRNNVRLEGKKMTREELSAMKAKQGNKIFYSDFQKIVLDFQLSTHEAYLRKFTNLFKEIDTETSGVIDESGFRLLLGRMGISVNEAEIERLLQIVDPYNNQRITYSECLSLLSSVLLLVRYLLKQEATQIEVVDEDGNTGLKTVSILEKFISESIQCLIRKQLLIIICCYIGLTTLQSISIVSPHFALPQNFVVLSKLEVASTCPKGCHSIPVISFSWANSISFSAPPSFTFQQINVLSELPLTSKSSIVGCQAMAVTSFLCCWNIFSVFIVLIS
eukprot:TRINITY_DN1266_c0_g1_i1.p3 TRINITY_DN1266_c0_g1~~TRINITY_DN1266_c0_g1_i1.p3  ORF type:complete len:630 (-),score=73.32 TRINITY_DN1266_c0_g1_i1:7118-9007(-)